MIYFILGLIFIILVIVNLKYEMQKSTHVTITMITLLIIVILSSSYVFYKKHNLSFWDYWDYKKQAMNYSKHYDPDHTYVFSNLENQGCEWMVGCSVIVKLDSTSSSDQLKILFNKGRLVPIARPREELN
ncbi:hypothetical protein ACFPES_20040 [Paenibacillus sp. GCM10023248]|uniref:hypothetical protein n=1 Tax=unclassified Paenibacillus TaxID=185978 RepID=UPI002379C2A5|nr:hypothetical protein [Paenibacillus sp. MAHUQ-63]MDD9269344.1 hypothetical protein [Paenibacillus sp. MAHUQ-63]